MHPAHVHSIATEVPEHVIDESVVRSHLVEWLGDDAQMHGVVLDLMHGTRVKSRAPADFCSTVHDVLSLPIVWMSPERRPSQSAA